MSRRALVAAAALAVAAATLCAAGGTFLSARSGALAGGIQVTELPARPAVPRRAVSDPIDAATDLRPPPPAGPSSTDADEGILYDGAELSDVDSAFNHALFDQVQACLSTGLLGDPTLFHMRGLGLVYDVYPEASGVSYVENARTVIVLKDGSQHDGAPFNDCVASGVDGIGVMVPADATPRSFSQRLKFGNFDVYASIEAARANPAILDKAGLTLEELDDLADRVRATDPDLDDG